MPSPDIKKIDELILQFSSSKDSSPQSAIVNGEELIRLSTEADYPKGIATGHFLKGYGTYKLSNYVSARFSLFEALSIFERLNDEEGIARVQNIIGQTYYFESEFDKSLEHNKISLDLRIRINDKEGIGHNYTNFGNIYSSLGDSPSAIDYYQKAMTIFSEIKDEYALGMVYNNLGGMYFRLNDYEKAFGLFDTTKEIASRLNHKHLYSTCLNNISSVLHFQGKFEESINLDLEALEIQRQIGDRYGEALSMGNLGGTYNSLGVNDKAIDYLTESISFRQTIGDKIGEAEASLELGRLYMKLKKPSRAKSFIESSIEIGKSLNLYNHLYTCHLFYSELLESTGEYQKALEQHKLHLEYWKRVFSDDSDKKLKNLQVLFEVDNQKKETEIYRLKNIELAQLNIEKNEFLGIAAHDLKNPLTGIILNTSTIRRNIDKLTKDEFLKRVGKIETTAERMQLIIKNMLDINAIEEGKLNLLYEKFDVRIVVKKVIDEFATAASQKDIKINFEQSDEKVMINTDGNSLIEILENLISNAIKYSASGKNVTVKCFRIGDKAEIVVEDNGLGFTEDDKKKVFKKFARLSAKPTGGEHSTGLGLSIVKKLTDILGGEITFESEPGKGTAFKLAFIAI